MDIVSALNKCSGTASDVIPVGKARRDKHRQTFQRHVKKTISRMTTPSEPKSSCIALVVLDEQVFGVAFILN